jgi:hypothetical protein
MLVGAFLSFGALNGVAVFKVSRRGEEQVV